MKLFSMLAATTLVAIGVAARSVNTPGDSAADFKFRESPVNALGIRGIADLRGKPILIDFWGHN